MKNIKAIYRYYVARFSGTAKKDIIHRESCPFIEHNKKLVFLGHFLTPEDAVKESEKLSDNPNTCRFCIPEIKKEYAESLFADRKVTDIMPGAGQLSQNINGASFYILN